ncbi:MAG: histone deacetylase, partial [Anaerolineae bacterium]|nr:histone deacetylase [Anaerolineae bacterium]
RERVQADLVPPVTLVEPDPATDEQLLRCHTPDYLASVKNGTLDPRAVRRIGFPWSPQIMERSRRSVGGTIAACRSALNHRCAVNLAGGTHHAYADHGEGYCVFNDVAVAARAMQVEGRARRILVIDCDVHQGNGTAALFADDASVFTFSIHGARNYPFHKEHSDFDVALDDGADDLTYLDALARGLDVAVKHADADLAIYLAGADPFASDRLGRMRVSKTGLAQRDRLVFEECLEVDLPVAVVMAGGYAPDVSDIVDIHFETVCQALDYAT